MSTQPFVHLHVHSHYSILDGASKIPELVAKAKEFGMPAVALTDHGNLFGAIEFYQAATGAGIKPILGYEAYVAPESRFTKTGGGGNYFHLTLLVKNEAGYRNIMRIASEAYLKGFYYKPRIDHEFLAAHSEGLICLSGCLKSELSQTLMHTEDKKKALEVAAKYRDMFAPGDYYVEIQYNGLELQKQALEASIPVARELGVKLIASNDVHYLTKASAKPHDVLLCIQTGKVMSDKSRLKFSTDEFYLKSPEEMAAVFRDYPEALANTLEVAEKVNLKLKFGEIHVPPFAPPPGLTPEGYFDQLCEEGMTLRYGQGWKEEGRFTNRLEYEKTVIKKMGFVGYFLIVQDFIRHSRKIGVPVGPGRGSAAGSIVAYALEITGIDPLEHGLIFERFLNEGRNEMPDIDIDFCKEGRGRVIDYVRDKYGQENVCQIVTFGTMAARAAIRDVGRVMEIPLAKVDQIAKKVPERPGITLQDAMKEEPDLREMFQKDPEARAILEASQEIEGLVRQPGTHAAGVIISDKPITEYCPLYKNGDDISTQYSMKFVEKIGLLKMDFLGLETLTQLANTLQVVKESTGDEIDLATLPLDDALTYQYIQKGETHGLFQVESHGMRELIRKLLPDRFDDLVALVAMYRPGPLGSGMVETYIEVKHGREKPTYLHPKLEPILNETHGVILYQEQAMKIAADLAGFTMTDADHLRKAMGKKKPEIMAKYKKQFIDGSIAAGVAGETATAIFDQIEFFAGYGFNKCLPGSTRVVNCETGRLVTLSELAGRPDGSGFPLVPALDEGRIVAARPDAIHDNGTQYVHRLTTETGRTISATGNHHFLTPKGWRRLDQLGPGAQVAVPMRVPYTPSAWLDEAGLAAVRRELAGDPAADLPELVFRIPREQLAEALSGFWNGLPPGDPAAPAAIWTPSERRARDLAHLHLRLGQPCEVEDVPAGVRGPAPYYAVRPIETRVPATVGAAVGPEEGGEEILWDVVRSIEFEGLEKTYDLTVPGPHNFVAEDVVVHNSHSAAYAFLTYQTAYLKAHYPTEFMAALLSTISHDATKVAKYVEETVRMKIDLLPPSINKSRGHFTVEAKNRVRYGLNAVKGLGDRAVESVLAARDEAGGFAPSAQGFFQLTECVDLTHVNKKVLECLVKSGALDDFGLPRAQLFSMMEKALRVGHDQQKNRSRGQATLFGGEDAPPPVEVGSIGEVAEWPDREKLAYERETLGFYFSGHPLQVFQTVLETYATAKAGELAELPPGREVMLGGMVHSVDERVTKRGRSAGEKMARVTLEDLTGSCQVVVFADRYKDVRSFVVPDAVVFVRGKIDEGQTTPSVIADEVMPLEEAQARLSKCLTIAIDSAEARVVEEKIVPLRSIVQNHTGKVPLLLAIDTGGATVYVRAGRDFSVQPSQELTREVNDLLGSGSLSFR